MKGDFRHINFENRINPNSYFDVIRIEELLNRKMNHDPFKNHIVEFYVMFFVLEGKGYHSIDFVDYEYQKGTMLLIRKGQVHKFFSSAETKGFLLIFTEDFIIGQMNNQEVLKSFNLFYDILNFPKIEFDTNKGAFLNFITLIKQLEYQYKFSDEFATCITRSLLQVVISELLRVKSRMGQLPSVKNRKYLKEFLFFQKMVEKSCFEYKKVMEYANRMGLSSKSLNNIAKTVVNKSAKVFIDEITIVQIKRLLIGTNHTIREVAYLSGFEDPSNFFRYFKKYIGTSPETFRKTHQ